MAHPRWHRLGLLCSVVLICLRLCSLHSPVFSAAGRLCGRAGRWQRASRRHLGLSQRAQDEEEEGGAEADWRAFRARLVQQEASQDGAEGNASDADNRSEADGWAYVTPLIEQGSILLSQPSDHFALNQQYFHKNVIFLVEHTDDFTRGVILNRPTAFSTHDLEDSLKDFAEEGVSDWNVWCGGDCQGINDRGERATPVYSVIHGLNHLAAQSECIISGIYTIDLEVAKSLVAAGKADKDDFLLLVGYCGWAPGQLQDELDRGNTWTMAAADQRTLLGELRAAQADLRKRISAAASGEIFTADDVGDGIDMWEKLYSVLGPSLQQRLADFKSTGDNAHTDELLRRWINRCLIPSRHSPEKLPASRVASIAEGLMNSNSTIETELKGGVILRASPTAWLLGKPAEHELFDMRRFAPGQYFHKAVVLLAGDIEEGGPALLALLNGPAISKDSEGLVLWGGPAAVGEMQVRSSKGSIRFRGLSVLLPKTLPLLIELGALEVVNDVDIDTILEAPMEERWQVAGGKIDSLAEASVAQLGDVQRQKWFKRFLGIDIASG